MKAKYFLLFYLFFLFTLGYSSVGLTDRNQWLDTGVDVDIMISSFLCLVDVIGFFIALHMPKFMNNG